MPAPQPPPSRYLPATVLCRDPYIIASFFEDIARHEARFIRWANQPERRDKRIWAILHQGYHYETPERVAYARAHLATLRAQAPNIEPVFLCNSPIDEANMKALGARAVFCSQNAFLHESRYRVTRQPREFNAIYLARITPVKRHALALAVPRLLLIGDYFDSESPYARGVLDARRPDTVWIRKVRGVFVYRYMNRARCGLCLSPEEGAMYAATEYGLCGLPVITTRCRGGREHALAPEFTHTIPSDAPTQADVADAVAATIAKGYDPHAVRRATIAVLDRHRAVYAEVMRAIFDEAKAGSPADLAKCLRFPHKFGLRCRTWPWFKFFHAARLKD